MNKEEYDMIFEMYVKDTGDRYEIEGQAASSNGEGVDAAKFLMMAADMLSQGEDFTATDLTLEATRRLLIAMMMGSSENGAEVFAKEIVDLMRLENTRLEDLFLNEDRD